MKLNHSISNIYSLWVHHTIYVYFEEKYQTCLHGKHQYHNFFNHNFTAYLMEADFFAFYQWDMIDKNQVELGLKDPDQRIQTSLSHWMCACFYMSWLNKYNSNPNFMCVTRFSYITSDVINCHSKTKIILILQLYLYFLQYAINLTFTAFILFLIEYYQMIVNLTCFESEH